MYYPMNICKNQSDGKNCNQNCYNLSDDRKYNYIILNGTFHPFLHQKDKQKQREFFENIWSTRRLKIHSNCFTSHLVNFATVNLQSDLQLQLDSSQLKGGQRDSKGKKRRQKKVCRKVEKQKKVFPSETNLRSNDERISWKRGNSLMFLAGTHRVAFCTVINL